MSSALDGRERSHSYDESFLRRGEDHVPEILMPHQEPSMLPTSSSSMSHNYPMQHDRLVHHPEENLVTPPLYRTNFGKSRAYVPPMNGVWTNGYKPTHQHTHYSDSEEDTGYIPVKSTRRQLPQHSVSEPKIVSRLPSLKDADRPFDEGGDDYDEPTTTALTPTTNGSPSRAGSDRSPPDERHYHSDQEILARRYTLAPPRISQPNVFLPPDILNAGSNTSADALKQQNSKSSQKSRTSQQSQSPASQHYQLSASSIALKQTPGRPINSATLEEFAVADGRNGASAERELPPADDDNDSLFDFDETEKRRKKGKKWRDRREKQRQLEEQGDDSSIEHSPAVSLTQRAHEAWKRKSARAAAAARGATSSPELTSSPAVSFGKSDTVHHFEPDPTPDPDPDDTLDSATFAGRSLNSEYTKSAESEVEDFIKDIFMIGSGKASNPGRRKIKYNPAVRQKMKEAGDDPSGIDTVEVPVDASPERQKRPSKRSIPKSNAHGSSDHSVDDDVGSVDEKKDDDALSNVWDMMQGGISAMSAALGLESGSGVDEKACFSPHRSSGAGGEKSGFPGFIADLLGSHSSGDAEKPNPNQVSAPSLEDDLRLIDLAVQAARSMHKLKGYEFDESAEINIVADIKFSVVDLVMPLGLIFQENDTGCWITKVLPRGNADRAGNVQVGDQLAAIDGVSAINLKVHEIAHLIKAKEGEIELTFLRYVGPLSPAPGTIAEEGYEVKAEKVAGASRPPRIPAAKPEAPPVLEIGVGSRVSSGRSPKKEPASVSPSSTRTKSSKSKKSSVSKKSAKCTPTPPKGKRRFRFFGRKS